MNQSGVDDVTGHVRRDLTKQRKVPEVNQLALIRCIVFCYIVLGDKNIYISIRGESIL
jgi:hypothetical protein